MKYRGYPGRDKVTLFVVDACLIAVAAVAGWYLPTGQMDHGSHQVLELLVDPQVPGLVAGNLGVPVGAAAAGPVLARVAVPEAAVHEHCDSRPAEGEVGSPRDSRSVTPPAPHPHRPQRSPQLHLGTGVPALHPGHHPAPHLW